MHPDHCARTAPRSISFLVSCAAPTQTDARRIAAPVLAIVAAATIASAPAAQATANVDRAVSGTTIRACYNTRTGTQRTFGSLRPLRPGQHCGSEAAAIHWSVAGGRGATGVAGVTGATGSAGPRGEAGERGAAGAAGVTGATGATGPTGETGATGERGPSDAYNAETGGGSPIGLPAEGGFVTIESVSVPAGAFLFLAKLQLLNSGGASGYVFCEFPGELDENSAVVAPAGSFGAGVAEIILQHAETLASAGTVSVECEAFGSGSAVVTSFDKLTALEIGTLH